MKTSIAFDLDGTLITCENKHKYVLYSILNRFTDINSPSIIHNWWILKRNGYNSENALSQVGVPLAKIISKEWESIVEDMTWCSLDSVFEDSLPVLEFLKSNHNLKIIILTARKSELPVIQVIQRFGLDQFVDDLIVVSPKEAIQDKSNYLTKAKPILFVGDTESDYKASLKSKTRFVALNRGLRSDAFLKNHDIPHIENHLKFLYSID